MSHAERKAARFVLHPSRPQYVTPVELEEMYPYHAKTWRRWVLRGRVRAIKPFGRILIPLEEVQRVMRDRQPLHFAYQELEEGMLQQAAPDGIEVAASSGFAEEAG